ncbi:MAG TPA: hypothetical protein DDX75_01885 [Phycisphaerales bacterium]|nr:hypothetical protein [Phycisphaerales bacterium]
MLEFGSIDITPVQLMLTVSKIVEGFKDVPVDSNLADLLNKLRSNPNLPVTLRCSVTSNYEYQNPKNTESSIFYVRCNLKILQKMGMVPGSTRPAVEIFARLLETIESAKGILYFEEITSEIWKGLEKEGLRYDKGRTMGLEAIFPHWGRNKISQIKADSVNSMYQSKKLKIRPHHLLCMTCFYGGKEFKPIIEDNLYEAIDIIHSNPNILIELICGPCMICPPCKFYCESSNQCISSNGMALRDELKDLDVLQMLGLNYGDVLTAKELFTKLYSKIISTDPICGLSDNKNRIPEWGICTESSNDKNSAYVKGRSQGLGFLHPF